MANYKSSIFDNTKPTRLSRVTAHIPRPRRPSPVARWRGRPVSHALPQARSHVPLPAPPPASALWLCTLNLGPALLDPDREEIFEALRELLRLAGLGDRNGREEERACEP